jgi:hypothetical protein
MFAALAATDVKYTYDYVGCYRGNSQIQPQNFTLLLDKNGELNIDAADAEKLPGGVIQYCAERAISYGFTNNTVFTVSSTWRQGVGCKF